MFIPTYYYIAITFRLNFLSFFLSLSCSSFSVTHLFIVIRGKHFLDCALGATEVGRGGGSALTGEIEKIEEKLINNQRLSLSEPPTKGARAR